MTIRNLKSFADPVTFAEAFWAIPKASVLPFVYTARGMERIAVRAADPAADAADLIVDLISDSISAIRKARMYARLGSTALSWNIANQMNEAYGCDISPEDFEDEKKMEEIFRKAYTPTEDQLALRKKKKEMEILKEKTEVVKEAVSVAREMATVQKDYEDFIKDNPEFEDLFK